jgi:hypothetical protein
MLHLFAYNALAFPSMAMTTTLGLHLACQADDYLISTNGVAVYLCLFFLCVMNSRKRRVQAHRFVNDRLLETDHRNAHNHQGGFLGRVLPTVGFSSDDEDTDGVENAKMRTCDNDDDQHHALNVWNSVRPRTKAAQIYKSEFSDKAAERRQEYTLSRKRKGQRNVLLLLLGVMVIGMGLSLVAGYAGVENLKQETNSTDMKGTRSVSMPQGCSNT